MLSSYSTEKYFFKVHFQYDKQNYGEESFLIFQLRALIQINISQFSNCYRMKWTNQSSLLLSYYSAA